jgi:hypothetical protein
MGRGQRACSVDLEHVLAGLDCVERHDLRAFTGVRAVDVEQLLVVRSDRAHNDVDTVLLDRRVRALALLEVDRVTVDVAWPHRVRDVVPHGERPWMHRHTTPGQREPRSSRAGMLPLCP